MSGIERIAAERDRQIEEEGWSAQHDNEHRNGEIAEAAACYILTGVSRVIAVSMYVRAHRIVGALWPWDIQWWKPSGGRIRQLEKAGALIAAEIDRLERAKHKPEREGGEVA